MKPILTPDHTAKPSLTANQQRIFDYIGSYIAESRLALFRHACRRCAATLSKV